MRARQFIVEYRRDKTAQAAGDKLIDALVLDRGSLPPDLSVMRGNVRGAKQTNKEFTTMEKAIINDYILAAIESKDPTKNKQYTQWLARMYANGDLKIEDMNRNNVLAMFDAAKKRRMIDAAHADINRFRSYRDFETAIMSYSDALQAKEENKVDKGKAETVYEDENVRIIHPEDETAACYYGQGTRWCTAATQGQNYFNYYNKSGPLYILLPKKPKYEGEKYQLQFPNEQFMDEGDEQIDLAELLTKRFPGLDQFFKKVEPKTFNDLLMFTDDAVLQGIADRCKELINDIIWETLYEWESSDDYFRKWQADEAKERGYVDDEGDVDWDRVYEDDELNDYADYNHEAGQWVKDAQRALNISPQEFRDAASAIYAYDGEMPHIENIDDVYNYILEDELGKDESRTLTDWIDKKLAVRSNKEGGYDVYVAKTEPVHKALQGR